MNLVISVSSIKNEAGCRPWGRGRELGAGAQVALAVGGWGTKRNLGSIFLVFSSNLTLRH